MLQNVYISAFVYLYYVQAKQYSHLSLAIYHVIEIPLI